MRSTTFFTTALQVGTFLTAAEAAHPKRREAPGYGANEDSVQWGTWSATTFQTVTTPYYKPEEAKPTYNSWAAVPNQPYKPPYVEGVDEEWNNWQEDEYTTTRKPLVIPTPYNPFSSTTKPYNQGYQSWEQGPNKYVTTETYNSWEQAKPSPTTYNYQSWVGAAEKRYNGEDYQGWQEASTKTPEVYQTWSQTMTRRPTQDFQNWQATPTNVISYSTKVVTIEEYESWSQASQSMASTTDAYQTWSEATAVPTKPVEQVQEWGQWQGQQGQGNGYQNGNGYANGNGNGYGNGIFPTTSAPAFNIPAIPTNPAAGLGGAGLGAGAGGVGGAGLPGVGGAGLPGVGGAGVPGLGGLPGLNALAGAGAGAGLPI